MKLHWILLTTMAIAQGAWAYQPTAVTDAPSDKTPAELEGVGVTEHLGKKIDTSLEFTAEDGSVGPLSRYFDGHKPVIMAIIYYNCPNLCNFQLNGFVETVKKMKGKPGDDYNFVAVSMDPKETHELAAAKKENYLKVLNMPGAEKGWHFLVGSEANVKTLADQVGFKFKWSDELNQYAHSAVTYILGPDGMISRYLHGIDFSPETLRLSVVEASNGKVGSVMEQFMLFCFQFDPSKNKYTLYAFNLMRVGAALTVLLLAVFLVPIWRRERQRRVRGA